MLSLRIFGIGLVVLGVLLFWATFWVACPYFAELLPIDCKWTPILSAIIYVIIGWFGGIGIPIVLFFAGIVCLIKEQ